LTTAERRFVPAHEVVEKGLGASRSSDCVVVVEERSEVELRFANNTNTTNGLRRDRRVTVVSFRGVASPPGPAPKGSSEGAAVAVGVASGSGSVDVTSLVRASEVDAEGGEAAADAAELVGDTPASPDFSDGLEMTSLDALRGVLGGLGDAFGRAASTDRTLAGFAEHQVATTYLGSSAGLRLRHVQPTGTVQLVGRSADGSVSAWVGAGTRNFEELDVGALEARLHQRMGWSARRVELPAGRYETILPPDAVADLMIVLGGAASGREAEDGQSVFSSPGGATRVGEVLSSLPFVLRSNPDEAGLECCPFLVAPASGPDVSVFDNGLQLEETRWLSDGRLSRLRYHRAGARRAGVVATPPIDNLVLELPGAATTIDEMVAGSDRALLLTCLWYIREVDPSTLLLTGLTRDGVYLVERGEVVGAVNNFRFNESPLDVLARAGEAGGSVRALSREWGEWESRTAMPALRIEDFNMSSVSPAT
jgi:predicted Zn-dependent protease